MPPGNLLIFRFRPGDPIDGLQAHTDVTAYDVIFRQLRTSTPPPHHHQLPPDVFIEEGKEEGGTAQDARDRSGQVRASVMCCSRGLERRQEEEEGG